MKKKTSIFIKIFAPLIIFSGIFVAIIMSQVKSVVTKEITTIFGNLSAQDTIVADIEKDVYKDFEMVFTGLTFMSKWTSELPEEEQHDITLGLCDIITQQFGATDVGVYITTDGGNTFSNLTPETSPNFVPPYERLDDVQDAFRKKESSYYITNKISKNGNTTQHYCMLVINYVYPEGSAFRDMAITKVMIPITREQLIPIANTAGFSYIGLISDGYVQMGTNMSRNHAFNPDAWAMMEGKDEAVFQIKSDGVIAHSFKIDKSLLSPTSDDLYAVMTFPDSAITSFSRSLIDRTIKIFIFCIAVLVLVTSITLFVILYRPISDLRKSTEQMATGDVDLTYRLPTRANDEFGIIATNFNAFIERLQKIMQAFNEQAKKLAEVSKNMKESTEEASTATTQITANMNSVKNQTADQNQQVLSTLDSAKHSSDTLHTTYSSVNTFAGELQETAATVVQVAGNTTSVTNNVLRMGKSFEQLIEAIKTGQASNEDIKNAIILIEEKSKALSDANTVIDNIAQETNLLAMNAAIEAAHAGEAGKGFAVVAGEIRKLAENSSKQSKHIAEEIESINNTIAAASSKGKNLDHAFTQIVSSSSSVEPLIEEVKLSMEEQNTATQDINKSLNSLKDGSVDILHQVETCINKMNDLSSSIQAVGDISSEISGAMDEMAAGSSQIADSSTHGRDEANNISAQADEINDLLKQFTLD